MGEIILIIFYIYGALAIFLLIFGHQETKSKTRELEIGVTGPIFTYKYQRPYGTMTAIIYKMGENYCGNSLFFGARFIFLLLCVHLDTESEWCQIYISIYQPISTH